MDLFAREFGGNLTEMQSRAREAIQAGDHSVSPSRTYSKQA
jgi:hypothetical protein